MIADDASAFAQVAIFASSAISIPLGQRWFERRGVHNFEFPVLIVLAALGMGMMVSAGDLISLYVGVELHSLALYVLAAMHRDNAKASEAGLKYFVLGALSSGLLLYGASLVYGFAGSTLFTDIAAAVHQRRQHRRAVRPGLPDLRPGLQGLRRAVPHVDAGRLRGRADAGRRLLRRRAEARRHGAVRPPAGQGFGGAVPNGSRCWWCSA